MARFVVVVDDDVDPSNLADVMWAVATRCEPAEGIDILRNAWSSALDPRISPDDNARGVTSHSKAIIDACRPFSWREKFPPTPALSADEVRGIEAKWGKVLDPRGGCAAYPNDTLILIPKRSAR
jgi:3-polyprenyl-4-hydroxybenzoate decarboxylase